MVDNIAVEKFRITFLAVHILNYLLNNNFNKLTNFTTD